MPVHKVIIGEGGEKYLPFALSRLRHFATIGAGTTAQKYTFEDGTVTVRVEYNPIHGNHFVRIDSNPGAVGYEFLTTFDDVRNDPTNWWSTAVAPAPKGLVAKLLSKTPTNGDPTPSTFRDPYARAINRQRNTQHFWWPADPDADIDAQVRTKPHFVTSTAGANSWQITALDWQNRMGSYVGDGTSGVWIAPVDFGVDVTVDVPPTIYEGGKALSGAPVPLAPNWWRRAATLEVDGNRYMVMSDSHSGFWCWPAEYQTDSGEAFLVPRDKVRYVRASEYMPPGVVVPSVQTMFPFERGIPKLVDRGLGFEWDIPAEDEIYFDPLTGLDVEPGTVPKNQLQKHQYLWDFRGDGTRAAAVIHTNLNNNHLWLTESASPVRALREYGPQYRIESGHSASPSFSSWISQAGGLADVQVTERAVLEVEFHISKEPDGGFTFAVSVNRLIEGAWFFDAQYAYRDRRLEALCVDGGALLTDEIRAYRKASRMPGQARADDQFIVTRNQDTATDVASFCVSRDRGFIAFDDWYFVNPGNGTYPGLVGSLPIHRWNFQDVIPDGAYSSAVLVASDLRSMSKVLRASANGTPQGLHAVVFGEVRQDKGVQLWVEGDTLALGQTRIAPAFVTPETGGSSDVSGAVELDTHRVIYSRITAGYGFSTTVHTGIASHPDGHFAVFAHYYGADGVFDLIEYRRVTRKEDGTLEETFDRTTHVAAFEKATKFTFDPAQYQANIPGLTPLVMQRFSGWRNVKMGKVKGGEFADINPRFEETP